MSVDAEFPASMAEAEKRAAQPEQRTKYSLRRYRNTSVAEQIKEMLYLKIVRLSKSTGAKSQ